MEEAVQRFVCQKLEKRTVKVLSDANRHNNLVIKHQIVWSVWHRKQETCIIRRNKLKDKVRKICNEQRWRNKHRKRLIYCNENYKGSLV
ncbi:hypothetical protein NXK88_002536 [Enterococcus hirae]|nr:hypothetical protein [Enterococcus hirae]